MLLDTNVLLWILFGEDRKIAKRAMKAISAPGARLVVSVVSIWEILIKRHAGKVWTEQDPDAIVRLVRSQAAWKVLPLEIHHFTALNGLDSFTDHTDPFDRLLIAQAVSENLKVVTADPQFSRYNVGVVW